MNLRNGEITVKEVLRSRGAENVLKSNFPNVPMFVVKMNGNKSLNEVLKLAAGRVSKTQIEKVQQALEAL